jgi:alanyl-tRNA synthetase
MSAMNVREIRASFLAFFEKNGHRVVPSSSLVPSEDPTLLFTNAGMNQFKDLFLGRETRAYTRAASSQKVMRVSGKHNDLDSVGPSYTHHTFFEMLGNFSFGDYFRQEAIPFAWTLLTREWGLAEDRLVATIFRGNTSVPRDDEAFELWRKLLPAERVGELGAADNFWQMGETGPCGRCSEIYYFRGAEVPCPAESRGQKCRGVECECDRYVEIWNNVFMEFDRQPDSTLVPLPARSIDTGMGLERIASVIEGKLSNYETEAFTPLLRAVWQAAPALREQVQKRDLEASLATGSGPQAVSARVVADHTRAMTFLIGDGVVPSNEWRGYVLRKIMRRAMRHGKHLGMMEPFLHTLVPVLAREMGEAYPELRRNQAMIEKTILAEEHRFDSVLTDGLPRLEAEIQKVVATSTRVLSGEVAFRLYDTFGVPPDFIEDTAAAHGVQVDKAGYDAAMQAQRDKARAQSAFGPGKTTDAFMVTDERALEAVGDQFEGYSSTRLPDVPILGLFNADRQPVDLLEQGTSGYALLGKTPFYLESGGQVSDAGRLVGTATGSTAIVDGLVRIRPGLPRAHRIRVASGSFRAHEHVTAEVDAEARDRTRRNHTATHLLHAALRQVLGDHVKQAGSLVAPDRLRFDFVHFQAVGREELDRIEQTVNEQIVRNAPVQTELRQTDEAIAAGAMALFGEKYGDTVRVVTVPDFSVELCGGTHVRATGDIGFFAVTSETSVAAGVRRIEALTGLDAVRWAQERRATLQRIVSALQANEDQAVDAIERMRAESKRLARDVSQLKTRLASGGPGAAQSGDVVEVAGVKLARRRVGDVDKSGLRELADSLKTTLQSGVVVLASASDGKVQIVVSVTPDLTSRVKAGQIVKEIAPIVGGGGGGRPDFAEAGGKDPEKIDEMLAASAGVLAKLLAS